MENLALAFLKPPHIYMVASLIDFILRILTVLSKVASSDESGMIIVWSNPVISAESRLVINEPG